MAFSRPELGQRYFPIRWHIVGYMLVVHILAGVALFNFSWVGLAALAIFYPLTAMGVTIGLHRLVTHRSFQTPKWLERVLVTFGALAAQGGPIEWVGLHRHHHLFSDQANDHHDSLRGLWWSHMGWMFCTVPAMKEIPRLTKDLQRDAWYVFLERYFLLLQVPIGFGLWLVGGWSAVLWGVFLRLVVVYHVTWLVNSVSHTFGAQRYITHDRSRNNWVVAMLTFGEGWHNNHHHKQARARHGLTPTQFDMSFWVIRRLEDAGLATNLIS